LDAGADIRARSRSDKTALDYAEKGTDTYATLRTAAEAAGMSIND
jgi:hypothetical protein